MRLPTRWEKKAIMDADPMMLHPPQNVKSLQAQVALHGAEQRTEVVGLDVWLFFTIKIPSNSESAIEIIVPIIPIKMPPIQ